MKKSYLFFGIIAICVNSGANAVPMNAQIRNLIRQKEEKIKKLEECEGKRKGWMIAGISTIGVTAVGVAGNIALADKSNQLTGEIDTSKQTLQSKQEHLSQLQQQAAERERAAELAQKKRNCTNYWDDERNDCIIRVEIGASCGENDTGVWAEQTDGKETCFKGGEKVNCACVTKNEESAVNLGTTSQVECEGESCYAAIGTQSPTEPKANKPEKTSFITDINFQGYCQKPFNEELVRGPKSDQQECNSLTRGEWIAWGANGKPVRGKSMCAKSGAGSFNQKGLVPNDAIQAEIQDEYNEWVRGGRYSYTNNFVMAGIRVNCYCKIDGETKWFFIDGDLGMGSCEPNCTQLCANGGIL